MELMVVTYASKLTLLIHTERLAREALGKLASLRRMMWMLDTKGLKVLYDASVRSSLVYACLAWGGVGSRHTTFLDKVQGRASRLINDSDAGQKPRLDTLQQRRDVVM